MNKMKFSAFRKIGQILAIGAFALSVASCEKKTAPVAPETPTFNVDAKEYFNVVFQGEDGYYVQAHTDITKGVISHEVGFEVPSQRAAYMFTTDNGKALHSINYGGGLIYKWNVNGPEDYVHAGAKSVSLKMGSEYVRWGQLSNELASVHIVPEYEKVYDENDVFLYTKAKARILPIDLTGNMKFMETADFDFPRSEEDKAKNLTAWGLSMPVLHNGKAYYAIGKGEYNPLTGDEYEGDREGVKHQATTLIVDFPSLKNPKMISSGVATGSAWRNLPKAHVYDGSIYQISGEYNDPCMLKITDDKYDDTYNLNISNLVNIKNVFCDGWLYAGNGIGYFIYFTEEEIKVEGQEDPDYISEWGIARLDLKTSKVTIMDLFGKFDLGRCQFAKLGLDGKLYMALSPDGEDGNIYIFDPTKDDANGFTKGATLTAVGGVSYVGVF